MTYAKECLDREAADLVDRLDLFTIPTESIFGGKEHPVRKRLMVRARTLFGLDPESADVSCDDSREEMEAIRAINAALLSGNPEHAAKLESDWNARIELRRAQAGISPAAGRMKVEGDVRLLHQAHQQGFI